MLDLSVKQHASQETPCGFLGFVEVFLQVSRPKIGHFWVGFGGKTVYLREKRVLKHRFFVEIGPKKDVAADRRFWRNRPKSTKMGRFSRVCLKQNLMRVVGFLAFFGSQQQRLFWGQNRRKPQAVNVVRVCLEIVRTRDVGSFTTLSEAYSRFVLLAK